MASWQTYALEAFLRLAIKRQLKSIQDISLSRARMERTTSALNFPPHVRRLPEIIPATETTPDLDMEWVDNPGLNPTRVILYLHGGGYIMGSPRTHRDLIWRLGRAADSRMAALDYRLAPENPYPAAVDDAEAAYDWLMDQGYDPRSIVVAGDSAGGGLTLALLLRLKASGKPQPAAALALSPWTDLTQTSDALVRHEKPEAMLLAGKIDIPTQAYVGEADPAHPEISPLNGDLAGLCPIIIHVGTQEILLDDATRFAAKVKDAGGHIRLKKWHRQPHVFQTMARFSPEGKKSIEQLGQFVRQHTIDLRNTRSAG